MLQTLPNGAVAGASTAGLHGLSTTPRYRAHAIGNVGLVTICTLAAACYGTVRIASSLACKRIAQPPIACTFPSP